MKDMWKLKEMLCDELDEFSKKGKMSAGDLQTVHMLTDTIKNISKIEMLEEGEGDDGYSSARRRRDARGRYSRDSGGYSREGGGYSYDDEDSYAGDMRGNMGGNYSRRRYSRADGKERMMEILEGMRDGVQGPEKQTVERMIDMVHKL